LQQNEPIFSKKQQQAGSYWKQENNASEDARDQN
jgi:hypothetical protein